MVYNMLMLVLSFTYVFIKNCCWLQKYVFLENYGKNNNLFPPFSFLHFQFLHCSLHIACQRNIAIKAGTKRTSPSFRRSFV